MTQVSISQLNKIYPGATVKAVDNLNLDIESGGLHALLGPSGCGKTTTMKMIAGLLTPTSGDILFNGVSQTPIPPEKRGAVMVFQNYLLFPYMSVGENVGFGLKMRGVDKATIKKKVAEMLELVQLPGVEDRRPKQLSGGQQQRIALARALIVQPNVLLLDEPLSNLDAHLRDEMRELIRGIQKDTKVTMVFVTHDQEEAVILADKIALIFDGVLRQNDTPDKFYEQPATERIARFFGGLNFLPGKLTDGRFDSSIGQFAVPQGVVDSGDALLSIRPESIEMGVADDASNIAMGRITSHVYMGTHTRYKVKVKDEVFQVVADPQSIKNFKEGDEVNLRFAPEKVWALPRS
jgi:ABC-type Fe3+/spermidine/putrescine transport system ATPase subunit